MINKNIIALGFVSFSTDMASSMLTSILLWKYFDAPSTILFSLSGMSIVFMVYLILLVKRVENV